MHVTTKDIAKKSGFSRGTVDRALNNKSGIKAETREMILRLANEMGYRPDILARSLVKGSTKSLGVVVFDVRNNFFAQMLNFLESEAKKLGYNLYITLTDKNRKDEAMLIEQLINRRVDGLIISPVNKGKYFNECVHKSDVPVVMIVNRVAGPWHSVGINDKAAVFDGLDYILDRGYEHVVFLCPPLAKKARENIYAQAERAKAFIDYFRKRTGIENEIIGDWKYEDRILELSCRRKKVAVFCSSSAYALNVLDLLKKNNRRVPDDIGLMGFDDIDFMKYISPRITTIDNPVELQAKAAIDSLIRLINKEEVPMLQFVPHSIIAGESL